MFQPISALPVAGYFLFLSEIKPKADLVVIFKKVCRSGNAGRWCVPEVSAVRPRRANWRLRPRMFVDRRDMVATLCRRKGEAVIGGGERWRVEVLAKDRYDV